MRRAALTNIVIVKVMINSIIIIVCHVPFVEDLRRRLMQTVWVAL